MSVYGLLIRNHWKSLIRSFRSKHQWLSIIAIGLILLYLTFVLVGMGFFFQEVFFSAPAGRDPVGFINRYLLEVFIGLFSLRFFLQQGPKMKMRAYLHLPISRVKLVRFFQAFSLLSFHNVIPYLFFLPFAFRYLLQGPFGKTGAITWLAGITCILLISHYNHQFAASYPFEKLSLLRRCHQRFFVSFHPRPDHQYPLFAHVLRSLV